MAPFLGLRGPSWAFVALRGPSWPFVAFRGSSWALRALPGRSWPSGLLRSIRIYIYIYICFCILYIYTPGDPPIPIFSDQCVSQSEERSSCRCAQQHDFGAEAFSRKCWCHITVTAVRSPGAVMQSHKGERSFTVSGAARSAGIEDSVSDTYFLLN